MVRDTLAVVVSPLAGAPPAPRRARRTLLVAAVLLVACGVGALPVRLAGLARSRVWRGERAARLLADLHGKDVAPHKSVVVEYGRGGQLRVYVSDFGDAGTAQRSLRAMLARLEAGETPFLPPHQFREDPGRWFTVGPGGHHAIWAAGGAVYWVSGDPNHLQEAVAELPAPLRGDWT